MNTVDVGAALGYVRNDSAWVKKLAIAALMVPLTVFFFIGAFILYGYAIEVVRRVANNHPQPLPEWDDFGTYLSRGFVGTVGVIIWFIPFIVIECCFALVTSIGDTGALSLVGNFGLSILGSAYAAAIIPVVVARYASKLTFNSMFDFAEILNDIPRLGINIVVIFALNIAASIILPISLIACFVGIFVASAYYTLVLAHIYGQIGAELYGAGMIPAEERPAF